MEKESNKELLDSSDIQKVIKEAVEEAVPSVTVPASINTAMEIINSPGMFAKVIPNH